MRRETEGDQKDTVIADVAEVKYNINPRTFKPRHEKKKTSEFSNPLEFYNLETRARLSVEEMLHPVFMDLEADRKKV